MKVGFYKNDLGDPAVFYDVDDADVIKEVAIDFAEANHQIDESSDMNFIVYVEDDACCRRSQRHTKVAKCRKCCRT